MAHIAAHGVYVPKYRLGKETQGWGRAEKAVANFDEDAITMAVAAGRECLAGVNPQEVDALFFATTTPPYQDQQGAAIVAEALDMRHDIFATDVSHTPRAGTIALRSAIDAVAGGSARRALVVAADCRTPTPRSDVEPNVGDGAAAVLVTSEGGLAAFLGSAVTSEHLLDTWRATGQAFPQSWEDRFVLDEGYSRLVPEAASKLLAAQRLKPESFARVCLYAPDKRRYSDLGRLMGFKPEQLQEPLFGSVGNTGAAYTLTLLASALDEANPGDRVLMLGYGAGADAFAFQATASAGPARNGSGLRRQIDARRLLPTYETYARWRNVWITAAASRPPAASPSVPALWRERDQNLRLYGAQCNACGACHYPARLICLQCGARDDFSTVRMVDRPGKVFTYTMDYLAGTVDVPLTVAVVDFIDGGRMVGMVTDVDVAEVSVGMPVSLSFRKVGTSGGIHNYYWKFTPAGPAQVGSQGAT